MSAKCGTLLFLAIMIVGGGRLLAQSQSCVDAKAAAANPDSVVCIDLQSAPLNMEPAQQPGAVRVDNRKPVTLHIANLGPLDSCSPTRSPSPTTETNPFQALVSSVSGLGGLGLGAQSSPRIAVLNAISTQMISAMVVNRALFGELTAKENDAARQRPPIELDVAYQHFNDLWKVFATGSPSVVSSDDVLQSIRAEQSDYDLSARALLTYIAADYRGEKWILFNPECLTSIGGHAASCDPRMSTIQTELNTTIDSINSVSDVQGNLDILTNLNSYLHKTYEGSDTGADAAHPIPRLPASINTLQEVDRELDNAKAIVSVLNDGITALKASQTALRTAYLAAVKLEEDSVHRAGLEVVSDPLNPAVLSAQATPTYPISIRINGVDHSILSQDISLGSDRKATVSGTVVCVSQTDMKTPTADTINYSILYQDIPAFNVSAGILLTFQRKVVIGETDVTTDKGATSTQEFAITDSARAQVFPMAFFNWHPGKFSYYETVRWGRTKEERLLMSVALTGGIGVNPNSGKSQPEFFAGPSAMLNKMIISPGVHFGRVQSLGGGFKIGDTVPSTLKDAPPLKYSYKPAFSIGFSYRIAPW